jgi:hypothetical protein
MSYCLGFRERIAWALLLWAIHGSVTHQISMAKRQNQIPHYYSLPAAVV